MADFGLLREIPQDDSIYYSTHNTPCPIRWMSPEAIVRRKFSAASDVWSFGILQWEMFYPAKTPYENMDNLQVCGWSYSIHVCIHALHVFINRFSRVQVAMKINEGYRLPTPRGCPAVVSRVMKACWHANPAKRPSFLLITTLLTSRVSTNSTGIYVN